MKWRKLIELRHKVISELGEDGLQEIIDLFKKNNGKKIPAEFEGQKYERDYGYKDAVIEFHDKNWPHWREEK